MSLKIYHQCGHCTNWNKSAFESGYGDGLIFSPVHEKRERIQNEKLYPRPLKNVSFFDPQFYLPNSQKTKLQTYSFFPEVISDGFSTVDFINSALEAATQCVSFQIEQEFDRIIIPARYFEQLVTNFCSAQETYTVRPFIRAITNLAANKPVYLTLPITSHMLFDEPFRVKLLNWITGFPEIDGVYLIVSSQRTTKQITDTNTIGNILEFLHELLHAGLKVVTGYCNSENILLPVVGDIDLTFGGYENTRIFSIDKFLDSDEDRRGPRARIYLPGLMNWILLEHARDIRSENPVLWDRLYSPSEDSERALDSKVEWAFNKPELYRHHFFSVHQQVMRFQQMTALERYNQLRSDLMQAEQAYAEIAESRIDLDVHGKGNHIQPWLTAINRYYRKHLNPNSN